MNEQPEIDLPSAWPCSIYDGFLELNDIVYDNEIPIPLAHVGSVRLKIDIADANDHQRWLEFVGNNAYLTLLGEPHYVEQIK